MLNGDVYSLRHKEKVQTQEKQEKGLLHTRVSLDMLDKRPQLGETGTETKTSLVEAGIHRQREIEQLPTAGWINRTGVWGLSRLITPRAKN